MRAEKILLSFFAVFIGLIVAGAAFYIYESTKTVSPGSIKSITAIQPSPTGKPAVFLAVDNPADESVTDKKILTVSGKTDPSATVVVSSQSQDVAVEPSSTGSFSLTINLTDDENKITVMAIAPNGEETQKTFTVTYSTEDF